MEAPETLEPPIGLALASPILPACIVSPQPEPPAIDPPTIDIARITLESPDEQTTMLVGATSAVDPGGAMLRALDLDTTLPGADVTVNADGSFQASLSGSWSDVYRLQAFANGKRSPPVDVTGALGLDGAHPAVDVAGPLSACLTLAPAHEIGPLDPGIVAALVITNQCSADVALAGLSLRLGSPAWTIAPAGPTNIPKNDARSFMVTFDPHDGDPLDDVLFVEVSAPAPGRRPITLRGKAQ